FSGRMSHARKFEFDLGDDRRWRGEMLSRARVLVWTEQGFGDSLMMFRYLPLLKAHGAAEVIVVCEPGLARVVRAMGAVDRVVSRGDDFSPSEFDLQIPIMSLPRAFKTRPDTVPDKVPYLCVPSALARAWGSRFPAEAGPKVGLAWAGGANLDADGARSIDLSMLDLLLDEKSIQWIS